MLYDGTKKTLGESVLGILNIYIQNKTSKKTLDDILKWAHEALPEDNILPRSKYTLLKLLEKLLPTSKETIKKHRTCEDCSQYLGLWSKNLKRCTNIQCNSVNINGAFLEFDIGALIKHFFEYQNLADSILKYQNSNSGADGYIDDINSGSVLKNLKNNVFTNVYDVFVLWNGDGTPVSHSSGRNIWLIQCQIVNIPQNHRRSFQFVCEIYYSSHDKPNMKSFLRPFVETMRVLSNQGIEWYDKKPNLKISSFVVAPVASCDCPARAEIQCMHHHNGRFDCFCCEQEGKKCEVGSGFNTVFPYIENLASKIQFHTKERIYTQARQCVDDNLKHVRGVKGPSIVSLIPHFDISTSFPPDYVHVILLGLFRMLLDCLTNSKNKGKPFYIKKKKEKY